MSRRARVIALAGLLAVALASCGDGRPRFCDQLQRRAGLEDLTAAIERGDFETAADEARALVELSASAPREVRPNLERLSEGVADVVALLEAERSAAEGSGSDGRPDQPTGDPPGAADLQRRRDELNDRLGELSADSSELSAWTREHCGFTLP